MNVLTVNHLPQKVDMAAHNPFIEYYENQVLGKHQQTDHGFYTGLTCQKGYGSELLLGSIACRFIPLLKPLAKVVGKRLLCAGTSFVSDIIGGKPVGVATHTVLKKFIEIRNKKQHRGKQPIIPKKRRQHKQDIFSK